MKFNLNSFLMGVSTALDLAEKEILNTSSFHSRRVAYISVRIAKELGLSDEEYFDLISLAILHDNGLTEAVLKHNTLHENKKLSDLEDIIEHCPIGEKNIENFPFLTNHKNIILYHHEHYDGSGFFGKKRDDIPLLARIISLADEVDFKFDVYDNSVKNQEKIITFLEKNSEILYCPKIVNVFIKISKNTSFWLDLQNNTIIQSIQDYLPNIDIDVTWEQIFGITKVFSHIIDSKSKFTYNHTGGLIEKVEKMAHFYECNKEKVIKLKIAASLHDLGKLAVPNKILEKDAPLNNEEFENIKEHTYFTHLTLRNIEGFKEIERWAYCHHEKLDGSGYPYGYSANELGFEERLVACMDIYQALTEERPYRTGMPHSEAMEIMNEMVEKNYIDASITKDIDKVFN